MIHSMIQWFNLMIQWFNLMNQRFNLRLQWFNLWFNYSILWFNDQILWFNVSILWFNYSILWFNDSLYDSMIHSMIQWFNLMIQWFIHIPASTVRNRNVARRLQFGLVRPNLSTTLTARFPKCYIWFVKISCVQNVVGTFHWTSL